MKPVRLQLSRRKGFSLQALSMATNGLPAVNVARPSKWGNPYRVGEPNPYALPGNLETEDGRREMAMDRTDCVNFYRLAFATVSLTCADNPVSALAGKNLACFCKIGEPCHADVLLELANPALTQTRG